MNELVRHFLDLKSSIDKEKYLRYFSTSLEMCDSKIVFSTKIRGTNDVIAKYETYPTRRFYDSSYCAICGYTKCEHINFLLKDIANEKKEELESYINSLLEVEEKKKRDKEQKIFLQSLEKLSSLIDKRDIYSSDNKIRFETYLDNDKHQITFRIGTTKMYKITYINKFITSYDTKSEITFGRDLTFIPSEELFDEREMKLIEFMKSSVKNGIIPNTPENELKVLKLNIGKYVYIDDAPFLVSETRYSPRVKISKDGTMSIVLDDSYLLCDNYFINLISRSIHLFEEDSIWRNFIYLVNDYPNVSCLNFLDEFKYSIYLKYVDRFDLDEEISENLRIERVKIKSYFDFEDDVISLKTKILRNDKIIQVESLDKLASKQYRKYINILNDYGFDNNIIVDEKKILRFLKSDFKHLKSVSEVYLSDKLKSKQMVKFISPNISIVYKNGMMEALMKTSEYTDEELAKIYASIKKKKNYVLLKNDRIVTLDENAVTFKNMVDDFSLDSTSLLVKQEVPMYQVFKAYAYEDHVKIDTYLKNLLNTIASFKKSEYELPYVNAELRKYQVEGFKWLSVLKDNHLGGILADDMGLGKTLQMITLISSLKENKPILIVSPKSLIFNWIKEFEKFLPEQKIIPLFGSSFEREELIFSIDMNEKIVYITSYDSLRSDVNEYKEKEFLLTILDEGQYIKNVMAKKTKSVKLIKSDYRFVLTGTPIENNIIDLWSLFDFIMPSYLPPVEIFKQNYECDPDYVKVVHKKVSPFILRRTKKEVLKDLPSKFEMVVTCEMNSSQRKLYDTFRKQAMNLLDEEGKQIEILSYLTRLRQICVDPSLFIEDYEDGSGKMDYLFEMIDTYLDNHHRLVIFSQFVKALDIVEKYIHKKKLSYYKITGETKAQDRVDICESFNSSDEVPICLVSLKAGGTGLNLIGADTVIHLDPWWNESVTNQATDRTYRIGQKKNVNVVKLICEDSIEQNVLKLQAMKKDLIDKVISSSDASITSLTKEDIKYILDR